MEARVTLMLLRSPIPKPDRQPMQESERQIECSQVESPRRTLCVAPKEPNPLPKTFRTDLLTAGIFTLDTEQTTASSKESTPDKLP